MAEGIITLGIGGSPGNLKWFFTLGLGTAFTVATDTFIGSVQGVGRVGAVDGVGRVGTVRTPGDIEPV